MWYFTKSTSAGLTSVSHDSVWLGHDSVWLGHDSVWLGHDSVWLRMSVHNLLIAYSLKYATRSESRYGLDSTGPTYQDSY